MTPKNYFVDARRSVAFETLEEAKAFAEQNFPAVVLEREVDPEGNWIWREICRFDWRWDAERQAAVIGWL